MMTERICLHCIHGDLRGAVKLLGGGRSSAMTCRVGESYRTRPARWACRNGKFVAADDEIVQARIAWIDGQKAYPLQNTP